MNDGEVLTGLRVLIVEDEFLLAMELETLIEGGGCTPVGPASSVRQALSMIDGDELDIVLLDVNLKGERATPVAAALQKRGVPYVLITGYSSAQLSEPELRAAPRLDKPVSLRALTRAVRQALNGGNPSPADSAAPGSGARERALPEARRDRRCGWRGSAPDGR